jgi:hypothetical protein
MRFIAATCAAVLASIAGVLAQAPAAEKAAPKAQVEQAFVAGGSIHLELSAGQYTVTPTADPKIRIRWTTRHPGEAVTATAKVQGTQARIDVSGPSNGFSVWIDVPARSNVTVSLSAGDFSIGAVDGDVDVSAWAGKMQVAVADPGAYYSVSASVTAGQIRAEPFNTPEKGGIFRSFSWEGKGRHAIRVRLTAGEIDFHKAETGT